MDINTKIMKTVVFDEEEKEMFALIASKLHYLHTTLKDANGLEASTTCIPKSYIEICSNLLIELSSDYENMIL